MRPTTKTTNLTPARTDLIGRDLEVARLRELFFDGRLVTITGLGGTGKTRLAKEFGQITVPDFPGGVWMIELANFEGVDEAMRELAQMLGLGFSGTASAVEPIIEALRNKPRTLLILDNLEHLVDEIADPIARMIDRTKEVCVLGTSREPVRIAGEQRFKLMPLSHEAAVKLFVRRAMEVIPTFKLDDSNRESVEQLVDRLDRLPLAIELAASRISVLPPAQLVSRLTERMTALRARDRDRPARHETIAATLEWSWDLLNEGQREGLAQCAAFRGGFTLDALQAVVQYDGEAEDLIEDLVERSLVEFEDTERGRRFYLFELVRGAAEQKLTDAGGAADVYRRHADYYVELVETTPPQRIYERQRDLANLLVALRRVDDDELKAKVAIAAARILRLTAGVPLVEETLSELVARIEDDGIVAQLLLFRAVAAFERRQFSDSLNDSARAIEHAQAVGDVETAADALTFHGFTLFSQGEREAGEATLTKGLELARKAGNARLETIALGNLAITASGAGDMARAEKLFEQAIARCRTAGDDVLMGRSLMNLGICQTYQDRWQEALANLEEALAYLDKVEDDRHRGITYNALGAVRAKLGESQRAFEAYSLGRDIAHALGNRTQETAALVGLGELGGGVGDRTYLVQAVQLNEGSTSFVDEAVARSHLAVHDLIGRRHELARPQLRRAIGFVVEPDPRWAGILWGYLALSYAMTQDRDPAHEALASMSDAWSPEPDDVEPLAAMIRDAVEVLLAGTAAATDEVRELREAIAERTEAMRGTFAHRSPHWSDHEPLDVLAGLLDSVFGPVSATTLSVSRDGRRFIPPQGEEVDFSRRGPLRKIIVALAEAREGRPGTGLSADDVLDAGWPGDIVTPDAGAARVYSAIRTLRTNGLEEVLLTQDDGYLIDPEVSILWLD